MASQKKFFDDKLALLQASILSFLAVLGSILIVFRLDGSRDGYITEYRSNLGISAFKTGDTISLLGFIVFALLVAAVHLVIGLRVYHLRRELSLMVLSLGILLEVIVIIVSNALLVLK